MSPGYDRAAHLDFRRVIDAGCMSCHNGYPRGLVQDDGAGPRFGEHASRRASTASVVMVPGRRMSTRSKRRLDRRSPGPSSIRRSSIVNGSSKSCMQCHLETTSSPLPFQIRTVRASAVLVHAGKAARATTSSTSITRPARARPRRQVRDRGRAYRLRKSACFQRSEMTCLTCHNPHDVPRGGTQCDALSCRVPRLPPGTRIAGGYREWPASAPARPASTATCRSGARKTPCTWS